jgi:hypothetical protein
VSVQAGREASADDETGGAGDMGGAGEIYAAVIADNVARQAARKTSLEQRGLSVITTAGALVTLQLALVAAITGADTFKFSAPEKVALGIALALFVAACTLGLLTNQTRKFPHLSSNQLEKYTEPEVWNTSADVARRRIARAQVQILRKTRALNGQKARLLRYAIRLEVGGIAAVAVCVLLILV